MSTTPTPAPQSEASKIIGLLFSLGTAAAALFIKNPNHVATAGNIINVLSALLPQVEALI